MATDANGQPIPDTTTTTQATPSVRGTSILDQLGINASDILQAPNVSSTITAPQAPVTDALGIFTAQENALGIPGLKTANQTATQNFLNAQNLANQEQLTIQGRAKKLRVLRGEQQQAAGQANVDLQTLQNAQNLTSNALNSAQATATQRANILYGEYQQKVDLQLQYPGLKINPLTDSFDKVTSKLKDYQEEQKKQAEKDAYKSALRELGLKTSGSRKELEKRLRKANKSSLDEAKKRADDEWRMKVDKFNKSMGSGSGSSTSISNLNSLLSKAAQMPSGGREWAASVASTFGVSKQDVINATQQNGWEQAYRSGSATLNIPKNIGKDEKGEDIYVDANGNRVKWVN